MAYPRAHLSPGKTQDGHAISLKVLRLSRPSLAVQAPLPTTHFGNGLDIAPQASCAFPSQGAGDGSNSVATRAPITELLTLPPAFGAAYVGETFTCTLCANNEVLEGAARKVSGVRVLAELQTPSDTAGTALELRSGGVEGGEETAEVESGAGYDVPPGGTLQRTLRHELKEEGPHVLAVTVSYTETAQGSAGGASGGRARTFRKLYQFVAQQAIAVRSKVTERRRKTQDASQASREWILETQLENVGESAVVLEKVWLSTMEGVKGIGVEDEKEKDAIVLKPQDVEQAMFILSEKGTLPDSASQAGRLALAQLNIDWRNAMGEKGSLTTGWLAAKAR